MNCLIWLQLKRNRFYMIFLIVFLFGCVSLFSGSHAARMQVKPLTLANIINGLQAEQGTLEKRLAILIKGVKERRVTFALTPEIEKELRDLGANNELLEAIRQNSPKPVATPTPTPTPPDFAFYRKRANEYADKKDFDRAISDYNEAIRLNPQDAVSFYSRGIAYHYQNNGTRAFEDYKTAVQITPELALLPILQCVSYDSAKPENLDKTIEECGKLLVQDADFSLAYYVRGNAYRDKKELDRAVADYTKFIEMNPQNVWAYIRRGDAYLDKKDYPRAIADYTRAIEMDAASELAKNNLQRAQTEQANAAKNSPESHPTDKTQPAQMISVGALNSRAVRLKTPLYPVGARKIGVQGRVEVQITLDENGNVLTAKAISGNAVFYAAAEDAARGSKFQPVMVNNQPVKASGFLVYNFTL